MAYLITFLTILTAFSACSVSKKHTTIQVYRKATYQVPDQLNPLTAFSTSENAISNILYEGLFTVNHALEIVPLLLKEWSLDQAGRVYRFTLKENIRFHDGSALTSEDILKTFQQLLAPSSTTHGRYSRIKKMRAIDQHTLEVALRSAYPPFIALLAAPAAKIIKTIRNENFPIGTGPFQFKKIEVAEGRKKLIFEKFPLYHGRFPNIENLEIIELSEKHALDGVRSGHIHDTSLLPYLGAGKVMDTDSSREVAAAGAVTWLLAFNTNKYPTSNEALRKCLVNSFDRETFIHKFIPEHSLALGILPPTLMGSGKIRENSIFNQKSCSRFLGLKLQIDFPSELQNGSSICNEMASYFKKLGVDLGCRGVPFEILVRNIKKGSTHISFLAQTLDLPDVEYFVETFESIAPLNLSQYKSKSFDALLSKARQEPDRSKRALLFSEINQDLYDHAVTLNISYPPHVSYWHKCLSGVDISVAGESFIDYKKIALRPDCQDRSSFYYGK